MPGPATRPTAVSEIRIGKRVNVRTLAIVVPNTETEPGQDQAAGNWLAPPTGPP